MEIHHCGREYRGSRRLWRTGLPQLANERGLPAAHLVTGPACGRRWQRHAIYQDKLKTN